MPQVNMNLTPAEKIAQNHAMNDDFMANIRAKLDMLGQVWISWILMFYFFNFQLYFFFQKLKTN